MASIIKKSVDGYGPYAYHVEWIGDTQKWTFLGRLDAVNVKLGPTDMSREEALEHRSTPDGRVTIGELDDPAMQEFAREFDGEDIEDVIRDMLLEKDHDAPRNILYAVKDVTDDERLEAAIDDVTNHYVEMNRKVTEEQAEYIKSELGDIIDVQITEPNNEYQDPMISLSVDDVALTENPDVNAELLSEATRTNAVTKNGQERQFEQWGETLGKDRVVEFKRSLDDPDALGFSLPTDVPATGDDADRTPVTEIPYIGEAKARDMHPDDEVLAIEDLHEMTDKQRAWIDIPADRKELDKQIPAGVARAVPELDEKNTADTLGHLLDLRDRRDYDGGMDWVDDANVLGIDPDAEFRTDSDRGLAPVTDVDTTGDNVEVETEAGDTQLFSEEYWTVIGEMRGAGVTVETADGEPAFARLPDGSDVIIAPQKSTD